MTRQASKKRRRDNSVIAICARVALLAMLVVFGSLVADRPAAAEGGVAAAAVASAGLGACSSNCGIDSVLDF